jgi:hypothetical protein
VARFSIFQSSSQTPQRRPTSPGGRTSLSNRKGSLGSRAHARFVSGGSAETPTTSAPSSSNFRASSRNRENWVPHPPVNALG